MADSPDSYYQEIGRAGRDGEPAEAVLFYRPEDLLGYFGEPMEEPCGSCDRCAAGPGAAPAGEEPFPVHGRVAHPAWGGGQIMGYEGDTVTVFFGSVGYKTLALGLVRAGDLLTPEG